MTAGVIAWHALVAAIGGVDLTDGCYVGRHQLSSRLPRAGQVQGLGRVPAAAIGQSTAWNNGAWGAGESGGTDPCIDGPDPGVCGPDPGVCGPYAGVCGP